MPLPDRADGFVFLDLLAEIRLQINDELLTPKPDYKHIVCSSALCVRHENNSAANISKKESSVSLAILATNKKVYDEAMPVLHSKNLRRVMCYGWKSQLIVTCTKQLSGSLKRDPLSLVLCANVDAGQNVRHALAEFDKLGKLEFFPEGWKVMESMVLEVYPGLGHANVDFWTPVECGVQSSITMTRQRNKPTTEKLKRLHTYFKSLRNIENGAHRASINLCKALIPDQGHGPLEDCIFGIEVIHWWDVDDSREEVERTVNLETGTYVSRNHWTCSVEIMEAYEE